jgi:hypothetical protein
MGRTARTEPQCLYKGAFYLFYLFVFPTWYCIMCKMWLLLASLKRIYLLYQNVSWQSSKLSLWNAHDSKYNTNIRPFLEFLMHKIIRLFVPTMGLSVTMFALKHDILTRIIGVILIMVNVALALLFWIIIDINISIFRLNNFTHI